MSGRRSNLFFTAATEKGINSINNNNNGAVNNGCRRRIYTNISALLYDEDTGLCRASSSDHKNSMNNGDRNNEDTTY